VQVGDHGFSRVSRSLLSLSPSAQAMHFCSRLAEIYNTLSAISNMPLLQQLINHAAHERELLRFDIDLIAELKAFRVTSFKRSLEMVAN
jgi:hypothetical protein